MVNDDQWRFPLICALVVGLSILRTESIDWLALSGLRDLPAWNRTSDCRREDLGLAKGQRKMCMRNLELMPSIVYAARTSVDVCQRLFYDSRWNCSSVRLAPKFLQDLKTGNREQAFVYALSSAALAHALSKACSSGVTGKCQCGPLPNEPPSGEFQWGGCGDDLSYGIAFSQSFVDWRWVQRGPRTRNTKALMTNLHNQRVGRKVVSESLQTVCKCHGVSGSCTTRTCWKALQDMRTIGIRLYHSYASAVEVRMRRNSRADRILVPVMHQARKNFTADELVYHSLSPDYCAPDPELGSVGTRGRECSKNSTGSLGCVSMCCGRGHTSEWVRVDYRCECKYIWCCYVKCQTCTKTVEVHRCR